MLTRPLVMAVVEIITAAVFISHWPKHEMISEFLYGDACYRRILTFYTLLHIAVLALDARSKTKQLCALAVGAGGWIVLVVCTNRGPRIWHCTGVIIYAIGIYVYVFMHSTDFSCPLNRIIQIAASLSLGITGGYAYLESYRTPYTYMVQHMLFSVAQVMYAFFVHYL